MKIEIRIAKYAEKQLIVNFIKEYWKENHIFVQWSELFDDYHKNGENINYMIAMEENTSKIYGVCGFIYANHNEKPDIWLALWKVIPSGFPTLGMDIVKHLHKELNCNILSCCGIKEEVQRLYRFLGYKTGTLKHYYRLNENMKEYSIARIQNRKIKRDLASGSSLYKINTEEEFLDIVDYNKESFYTNVPHKDMNYIIKKYFHNIAYKYQMWAVINQNNSINAFFITKCLEINTKKVLRIVDFYGDEKELQKCGNCLDMLLKDNDYEYVDFYEYGLGEETLKGLGMTLRESNDVNIIPNYFEPFTQENINIYFFTSELKSFRMFKADGDQERPNCIYKKV